MDEINLTIKDDLNGKISNINDKIKYKLEKVEKIKE